MKSPFPGMDPYMESGWGDAHARFAVYAADLLQQNLPPGFVTKVEEEVRLIGVGDDRTRYRVPDASVLKSRPRRPAPAVASANGHGTAAVLTVPLVVDSSPGEFTQRSIRIVEAKSGWPLVAAIEFISPANKSAEGADDYRRKRRDYLAGGVSLVEVDLLRTGRHVTAAPLENLPAEYRRPYRVCVTRGWRPHQVECYPAGFRSRLPVIAIPLRHGLPDVPLDLQVALDEVYARGSYAQTLDYRQEPEPPLNADDAKWADALLRKAGLRGRKRR